MKAIKLVSKSAFIFYVTNPWLNSRELKQIRNYYLWLARVPQKTFSEHHPTDPLIESLRAQLVKSEPGYRRTLSSLCYRYQAFCRRFLPAPSVLRDDLPPCAPKARPIRLINPDKVMGVFYEHNNKLH